MTGTCAKAHSFLIVQVDVREDFVCDFLFLKIIIRIIFCGISGRYLIIRVRIYLFIGVL